MSDLWQVCIQGQPEELCEISIVHKDYDLGQRSFGWDGRGKLIICSEKLPKPIFDDIVAVAEKWAAWLTESCQNNNRLTFLQGSR